MKLKTINIENALFFLTFFSIFFEIFYIDVGISFKPFMLFLILDCVYIAMIRKKFSITIKLYELIYGLALLLAIILGYFSSDKISYFRMSLGIVLIISFYWIVIILGNRLNYRNINRTIFYGYMLFYIVSLLMFFFTDIGGKLDRGLYRLTGTIHDPNIYCIYNLFGTGMALYNFKEKKEKKWLIILILSLITLGLTMSRGGILGTLIYLVLYFFYIEKNKKKSTIFLLSILTLFFLIVFFYNDGLYFEIIENIIGSRVKNDAGGSGRLILWQIGLEAFFKYPLKGIGLYNFLSYSKNLTPLSNYLHNTFLEILVENGIIVFVMILISIFLLLFSKNKNKFSKNIKLIILGQMVMAFFLSLIINEFIYFTLALYRITILMGEKDEIEYKYFGGN